MPHWLKKIATLLQAETADLRELARIAGANPKTFYRGIKLEDLDVSGQNLDGMGFSTNLPILDLSDAAVRRMIKSAKRRGYATHDEINEVLSDYESTSNQIEDVFAMLSEMGIDVVAIENDASRIVGRIKKYTRQEERIAALLEVILHDHDIGISALAEYKHDRAKFARRVISYIRHSLLSENSPQLRDEIIIAKLIPRFYADAFPTSRGFVLYFMAFYLAKYPLVNQAIRICLDRSRSMFVDEHRTEIEKILSLHRAENGTDSP